VKWLNNAIERVLFGPKNSVTTTTASGAVITIESRRSKEELQEILDQLVVDLGDRLDVPDKLADCTIELNAQP
jgi:hypothetical protein